MTTRDLLIAELTEQRDRARSIAVALEQEAHALREALIPAARLLTRVAGSDYFADQEAEDVVAAAARALADAAVQGVS